MLEGLGDGLLGSADPHGEEVGCPALDELPVEGLGEVAGELGLAGTGMAMEEEIHGVAVARSPPLVERAHGPENRVWRSIRVEDSWVIVIDHGDGR